MKYFSAAVALIVGTAVAAEEVPSWRDQAVTLVRAHDYIVDATWSQNISFWVTMADRGYSHNGYAETICFDLNDAGRPQGEFVVVTIWDAASTGTDSPRQIGRATCR